MLCDLLPAPASFKLYQINTDKCLILLNYHFIDTICNSKMFHPVTGHLQGVQFMHSSSVCQQNESPAGNQVKRISK